MLIRPEENAAPQGAAFFDLDRTLIPGSSLFLLARGLHHQDELRFAWRDMVRFGWGQVSFRLRGEVDWAMGMSRRSSLALVAGRSQAQMSSWCAEIARDRILPRVYPGMARIIAGHKEGGDATYLVTAAPIELAETLAHQLGLTGAIGTVAEVDDDGRYTGQLRDSILHGDSKAEAVAERARQLGLDLARCSAYSDSMSDLPLLEMVGAPHAVNPARQLARLAARRGWPVHDLRGRGRAGMISAAGAIAVAGAAMASRPWRRRHGSIKASGRRWRRGRRPGRRAGGS